MRLCSPPKASSRSRVALFLSPGLSLVSKHEGSLLLCKERNRRRRCENLMVFRPKKIYKSLEHRGVFKVLFLGVLLRIQSSRPFVRVRRVVVVVVVVVIVVASFLLVVLSRTSKKKCARVCVLSLSLSLSLFL